MPASFIPLTRNPFADGAPQYADELRRMDPKAHDVLRTAAPVFNAVDKLGTRMGAFDIAVITEETTDYARQVQEIVDAAHHVPEFIREMAWALPEGARYCHMKPIPDPADHYTTLTFGEGIRRKFLASNPANGEGSIHNDGTRLWQVRQHAGTEIREARRLNSAEWVAFIPRLMSNPEGDPTMGRVLYKLATAWHRFWDYILDHAELYGVPMKTLRSTSPWRGRVTELQEEMAQAVTELQAARGGNALHVGELEVRLMETTKGFGELKDMLETVGEWVYRLILMNTLTSTVSNADRTGNTLVHLSEEDRVAHMWAVALMEAASPKIIARIDDLNDPLLAEKTPLYLYPVPQGLRARGQLLRPEDLVDPGDSANKSEPAAETEQVDPRRGTTAGGRSTTDDEPAFENRIAAVSGNGNGEHEDDE
jgi:hypothetical protein